jgi:hypothetical protein
MKKRALPILGNYQANINVSRTISNVLISLMMASVAVGFVQFGERMSPEWHGRYLPVVAFIISLEAIYTRRQTRELEGRQRWFFHISEWIAIAIALKIFIYLIHDPRQILVDIPYWQKDFLLYFFSGEYLLAIIVTAVVWLIAKFNAREFDDLHEREYDATWDELGKVQNALHGIRAKIVSRTYMIGMLVVALAVLSRINVTFLVRETHFVPPGYNAPVLNVVAYFALALVLLSQTQFTLLRTRWLWQKITIDPRIARNWFRYGLAAAVFLAVVVAFLPTEYSLGLVDTLRVMLNLLIQGLSLLLYLVMLPVTFCMSLFRFQTDNQTTQAPDTPPLMPPAIAEQSATPVAWLEILKSIAFWVIFIVVIVFAIRYYLSQNVVLWTAIRNFPLFRWASGFFNGIWGFLRGANRQISGMVRAGVKRLRRPRAGSPVQAIRRMFNLARLNPREKVIYFYLSLIHLGGERGLNRRESQTPYQYEQRLEEAIPDVEEELHGLTETFLEARYSRHTVEEPQAEKASSLLEHIKAVMRSWKRD